MPLHAIGALAAGEHRGVEGEMSQQVERAGARLAPVRSDLPDIKAALGKVVEVAGPDVLFVGSQ